MHVRLLAFGIGPFGGKALVPFVISFGSLRDALTVVAALILQVGPLGIISGRCSVSFGGLVPIEARNGVDETVD